MESSVKRPIEAVNQSRMAKRGNQASRHEPGRVSHRVRAAISLFFLPIGISHEIWLQFLVVRIRGRWRFGSKENVRLWAWLLIDITTISHPPRPTQVSGEPIRRKQPIYWKDNIIFHYSNKICLKYKNVIFHQFLLCG